jgi:PTH1 family peptidyl-tRNA hydrolase
MKLIIGLGNPGKQYAKTRHNLGFIVLNALQEKLKEEGISKWELSKKFNAEVCDLTLNNEKIILAKPMTFMNESGIAVGLLAHFYKITTKELLVVHDDKDLKLGDIRIQTDKSDAGHNGVKSIIQHLNTQNFTRVRLGIAPEKESKMKDTADFVLSKFGLFEKKKVDEVVERSVEEIIHLIT